MKSVTWRCWLIYQVAAVPLSLFCWYATLFWLAVVVFHASSPEPWVWPMTAMDVALAIGFWAFGAVHLVGLYYGHRVPASLRWTLFLLPLPWLVSFLQKLLDDDLSFPGDGLLPLGLPAAAATSYLVLLTALLVAALLVAVGETVELRRA